MAKEGTAAGSSWMLPARVDLDTEDLVWVSATDGARQRRVYPAPDLLEAFTALSDGPAADILEYARRWGVLCLCSHGLPSSHNPGDLSGPPFSSLARAAPVLSSGCQPVRSTVRDGRGRTLAVSREPISTWRRYALLASLTLEAGSALHRSNPVEDSTWESLLGVSSATADDAERLSFAVRAWLRTCDVRVGFDWRRAARPTFLAGSMLGAVALQIAFSVSGDAAVSCTSCGAPFVPSRKPPVGRRAYCPTCRELGVPARDAARDYWHRKGKYRRKKSSS